VCTFITPVCPRAARIWRSNDSARTPNRPAARHASSPAEMPSARMRRSTSSTTSATHTHVILVMSTDPSMRPVRPCMDESSGACAFLTVVRHEHPFATGTAAGRIPADASGTHDR
jgi:hypothetical protein